MHIRFDQVFRRYAQCVCAITLLAASAALTSQSALSAVSAEEAEKLKTTLTPFGAERAGSKDGSIPAWSGSPGKESGGSGGKWADPFAGEKPLYSVTAQNLAQFDALLSDGQKAMLKKYPDYRIDVYPTHRTGIAPQWVYDNTFSNATSATLEGGNLKVVGAYGGIPFPIPKSGDEAIWNHILHWAPPSDVNDNSSYSITSDGSRVLLSSQKIVEQRPFYIQGAKEKFEGYYWKLYLASYAPSFRSGEAYVGWEAIDRADKVDPAWTYLPGQRRVRKLPVAAYDTPLPTTSGFSTFDEVHVFAGAPDRYEWKLLGKKEMIIPYNANRTMAASEDELMGKHFANPDLLRWEVHRVWVVDAQLKAGKRHQIPHKRFYLDEDTWIAVLADGWDAQGQLWKSYWQWLVDMTDLPGAAPVAYGDYDLLKGGYLAENMISTKQNHYAVQKQPFSDDTFTPEAMTAAGQ